MITEVRYERLYNLGNFENVKFGATAIVDESGYALAYAECRTAVEYQYAFFMTEREADTALRQAEWDRRQKSHYTIRQADNDEELPL